MVSRQLGRLTAKVMQGARPSVMRDRATAFGKRLKAEYEAGLRDDPSAEEQQEAAADVTAALRNVDWAKVRAATADRSAEATQKVKAMAEQVDWERVTPVAAGVSSALIAAVASGQIRLGGTLGSRVARTIMNDRGLAQQVAAAFTRSPQQAPPDFRPLISTVIDTTATEGEAVAPGDEAQNT